MVERPSRGTDPSCASTRNVNLSSGDNGPSLQKEKIRLDGRATHEVTYCRRFSFHCDWSSLAGSVLSDIFWEPSPTTRTMRLRFTLGQACEESLSAETTVIGAELE